MEKFFTENPLAIVCCVGAALVLTSLIDSKLLILFGAAVGFFIGKHLDSQRKRPVRHE